MRHSQLAADSQCEELLFLRFVCDLLSNNMVSEIILHFPLSNLLPTLLDY